MTQHVLVTGGAGYVGSHACKALAAAGYVPVTLDNLDRGYAWAVKWGPFEDGDITDQPRLEAVLRHYAPVAVMHFAAHSLVGESAEQPEIYYRNNVGGTLCLLEAMRACAVSRIIFSSSCAIYGEPSQVPIPEDHREAPISPYGASKAMVERMLRDFDSAHGIRSSSLRYFNAAGADPEAEIGEAHDPETHLIPLVLDVALGRRAEIAIFGDDYETDDGTCVRDYIHVADLADAHVLALKRLVDGAESGYFNLGNGQGFSVRQVIETATRVTGKAIAAVVAPRRPGDPPKLVADSVRAKQELGWRPQRFELEIQIADAWKWHQSHYGGKA